MIAPDSNLLLYVYDSESLFFERARQWWSECLNGSAAVGSMHPVIFAFLRTSTNEECVPATAIFEQGDG